MERKIGEIFELGGEWYQCVESDNCGECSLFTTECGSGTKSDLADKVVGQCSKVRRTDNKHVIFKKLEKVGEPYMLEDKKFQKYRVFKTPYIYHKIDCSWQSFSDLYYISLEIKQTKEDMEETKLNIKPFSLEAAKAGKPVCTRDGRKARIICFNLQSIEKTPIVAAVQVTDKQEVISHYYEDGRHFVDGISELDLMMLPEKKEGWINIYNADTTFYYADGRVFETKDEAVQEAKEEVKKEQREKNEYIDTIRVEWEE